MEGNSDNNATHITVSCPNRKKLSGQSNMDQINIAKMRYNVGMITVVSLITELVYLKKRKITKIQPQGNQIFDQIFDQIYILQKTNKQTRRETILFVNWNIYHS